MAGTDALENIRSQLQEGMKLRKCRKCGCMKEALESLRASLPELEAKGALNLLSDVKGWLKRMEPIRYACLGCDYCFPAAAMNGFHRAFPEPDAKQAVHCAFEVSGRGWPPVAGDYYAFCDGPGCPVAVSTLASADLAVRLARRRPEELCIVGKTETENIGIDKVIKNTVTNPTIRFLLLVGKDPKGHRSGKTLLGLWENGVDEKMKVPGSPGRRPVLRNVTREEIEAFRRQVQVVDMIGCEDVEEIIQKIRELGRKPGSSCGCEGICKPEGSFPISQAPVVRAEPPAKVEMDKAGYFVILPRPESRVIVVEHYSYENKLQRVIEGKDARNICWTIIKNGWVTQLSHAAYLGRELAKAELSIKLGFKYVQDGA